MNREEFIKSGLYLHLHIFEKNHPNLEWFALVIQGSQNYELDIYTEEYKSDIDTKMLVIPCVSELLVKAITKKQDNVMNRCVEQIFLPKGTWYDFKTGKKFPGNRRYVAFYKDEDYPVFAKSGSIIPLAILGENLNDTNPPEGLEIHVFPGRSNIYK